MDDIFDEASDDLSIAARDFHRHLAHVSTSALRDGSLAGRDDSAAFSAGYREAHCRGRAVGLRIGALRGRFQALDRLGLLPPAARTDLASRLARLTPAAAAAAAAVRVETELSALRTRLEEAEALPDDVRGLRGLSLGPPE